MTVKKWFLNKQMKKDLKITSTEKKIKIHYSSNPKLCLEKKSIIELIAIQRLHK